MQSITTFHTVLTGMAIVPLGFAMAFAFMAIITRENDRAARGEC